jgi:hypothetical protein
VHGRYLFGDPFSVTVLGEVDSAAGVADGLIMGGRDDG